MADTAIAGAVAAALDPVLVPAGFQAAQVGGDDLEGAQLIWCGAYAGFGSRHAWLPQAHDQPDNPIACVDLVIDIDRDGRLGRLDLESLSLAATLRSVGRDGEARRAETLIGRAVVDVRDDLATVIAMALAPPAS